jgi:uncharacterized protein
MPTNLETAHRLYAAFAAADGPALLALLDPGFQAEVTAGLPEGWGGRYEGAERMLSECWGAVFTRLDTHPVPSEYLEAADGRIVVLGRYLGRARDTGRAHDAAFAHVLRFRDGRICGLVQITDSERWHEALRP